MSGTPEKKLKKAPSGGAGAFAALASTATGTAAKKPRTVRKASKVKPEVASFVPRRVHSSSGQAPTGR